MSAAWLAALAIISFAFGYRFYSKYLAERLFQLNEDRPTPAQSLEDRVDYCPTRASVLFGHHFASIAGAAPIVGPAVAVIWGWVPALVWVVLGTIFMGAAHDFGALVLSMRHRGQSIGQLTAEIIGPRVRTLFLVVIFFLVWLVIAVFALVIANLFMSFPETVLPVNFEIIVALLIGYFVNRKGGSILWPAIFAQVGLFITIYLGTLYPISLEFLAVGQQRMAWIIFLLVYSSVASVLPVWTLLQPRDYINSHQLMIGLAGLIAGLFIVQPTVVAPAFNLHPEGAPSWFPFLFITIACGAVSGFHGLVSSGTTSKQVFRWRDSRAIGYGGMIGEGTLALLATLAVSAGFASSEAWHNHYASWGKAKGLSASISGFVEGSSLFLSGVGISKEFGQTMIAVLIISFAATSLDTATRIQRYVVSEIGSDIKIEMLRNRYFSSGLAVLSAFALMLFAEGGKGGLLLWPLFGATNQMLAALTLVVITVYLLKQGKTSIAYLAPMIFLIIVTILGLLFNVKLFYLRHEYLLMAMAIVLLIVEIWIAIEAIFAVRQARFTESS